MTIQISSLANSNIKPRIKSRSSKIGKAAVVDYFNKDSQDLLQYCIFSKSELEQDMNHRCTYGRYVCTGYGTLPLLTYMQHLGPSYA